MRNRTWAITLVALGGLGLAGFAAGARVGPPQKQHDHAHQHDQGHGEHQQQGGQPDMGAALMQGLSETPGCLGVDAGQFRSGKNAIIAWFEDKAAVERWYHSETHMQTMRMAMGDEFMEMQEHKPLRHVQDDVPIMVIASITFADRPHLEGISLPISQIAIEVYSPQPGGAHVNGRLAPAAFPVDHMKAYTPPAGE